VTSIATADVPRTLDPCSQIQSVVHARSVAKGGSIRISFVPAPRIQGEPYCVSSSASTICVSIALVWARYGRITVSQLAHLEALQDAMELHGAFVPASGAPGDIADGLAGPLVVEEVERVLQYSRIPPAVLRERCGRFTSARSISS
jgi:hypothetical protein